MRPLKSLTVEARVELLATTGAALEEPRAADHLTSRLHATVRRGFALRFFPPPSRWQFQRALPPKRRRGKLPTSCGVQEVPADTQRREPWGRGGPQPAGAGVPAAGGE